MARPRRTRLSVNELESRCTPAVLAYTAPSGNGPDLVTVKLDPTLKKILILDNGTQVTSRTLNTTDSVAITGSAGSISHRPFFGSPTRAANTASESKRGRQSQSIDPPRLTSAAVWVLPIMP